MKDRTLALMLAEDHNEVDCCALHWRVFNEALVVLGFAHPSLSLAAVN